MEKLKKEVNKSILMACWKIITAPWFATSTSGDNFFVLMYAVTNGPFAPTKIPAKPDINPQNQSFRMTEIIKLSKGAQVKKIIVPAINHKSICSDKEPNKKIPATAPKIVAIKIFFMRIHWKNSLYTNTLDKLLANWIDPWRGIRVPGEKDWAKATSIIMPPPTLKIEVSKDVKKESIAKKVINSTDI